jgi:hypothetical protein
MRKKYTNFVAMSTDQTNTYQQAKQVFLTLGFREDTSVDIPEHHLKIFRKHLSEMVKRQKSSNKYATRAENGKVFIVRIQ